MQVAAQRKKFAVAYQKYPYGPEACARRNTNYIHIYNSAFSCQQMTV